MSITTSDGVRLAVEKEGAGPGLVLVHGLGGAKEDFSDHVAALARDHTVVIFDHRGHGASENPEDPAAYSLDRMVADVLEVADWAGFDSFRLLGHSMGGMVARKVVIAAPRRIDALVMMDTSCGPIPGFDPDLVEVAAEVALTRGKAALKELLEAAPVLETPAHQRVLAERPGYQAFEERKWADLSAVAWGVIVRELAHQTDDLTALASTLPAPLLVLVGEQDKPFVIASQAMKDAIPTAELVVIKNAGHSPQFESPETWIEAMTKFLAPIP